MNEFELFFVGWFGYDGIPFLKDGPYVDSALARRQAERLNEASQHAGYVVCKVTLPFTVVEV